MSESVKLANLAREYLASALNELQSAADVPDELMNVADPIAEAMSVLHRIESSRGSVLDGRAEVLASVRAAIDMIEVLPVSHPTLESVTDSVAMALSKAIALARYTPSQTIDAGPSAPAPSEVEQAPTTKKPVDLATPAPPPAADPEPAAVMPLPVAMPAPLPVAAPKPLPVAAPEPLPVAAPAPLPVVAPAPLPIAGPLPIAAPAPLPVAAPVAVAPPPLQPAIEAPSLQTLEAPVIAQSPPAAVQPEPRGNPMRGDLETLRTVSPQPSTISKQSVPVVAPPAYEPSVKIREAPPPRPAGAPSIDVELGTNSSSNFYKGLGGNDVVEHGGIFVATYKVPKIGSAVALRVLLPGNYEFFANAVVQWTRGSGITSDSEDPGFGARITQISQEGRQLVYRYTRNREPIFFDDL